MIKYADDTYLIIAENKINSTSAEIKNIVNWAKENNLRLNQQKSKEILFCRPRYKQDLPQSIKDIPRCDTINILGVTMDNKMRVQKHVQHSIMKCSSYLYGCLLYTSDAADE